MSALRERIAGIVAEHLERRARGESHPVLDFLFDYYGCRPAHLLREPSGRRPLPARRRRAAEWVAGLLAASLERPPQWGCHGLHEWAMVYRGQAKRHDLPFRLSPAEIDAVVESLPVTCTHFDAVRFFTPAAAPLNRVPVSRERQADWEQPACLHANMDLFKWAYRFQPWVPVVLMQEAFLLAVDIREVDMRASPYDLSRWGYEPIRIETPAGRAEYQRLQAELMQRAQPLRARLLTEFRALLDSTRPVPCAESPARPGCESWSFVRS